MVDRDVFDRRLTRLEGLLENLRRLAAAECGLFLSDKALQAQAERWLHLASQCAIDLAHHLIADRGWSTPATYREAFAILQREGVLSTGLAAQMERWAALRNVLVHLYLEIDYEILFDILKNDLDQLASYAAAMVKHTASDPS